MRPVLVCVRVIDGNAQARAHARALAGVRPFVRTSAFDLDGDRALRFAHEMGEVLGGDIVAVDDPLEAARASDVVVTCTTSRRAFLWADHVAPGTFVAAVGADSADKSEIAPELMARAKVIVDVLAQCEKMGDLRAAIAAGAMDAADVHAELGELITEEKPGRGSAGEVVVFDSTGTALTDVASAAVTFDLAVQRAAGTLVALGAS